MLQMMPWVRSLLFDLMILLDKVKKNLVLLFRSYFMQSDERDVSVWSAAISCFVHLTTANGEFVSSLVENLPISILVKALRISIESGWYSKRTSRFSSLFLGRMKFTLICCDCSSSFSIERQFKVKTLFLMLLMACRDRRSRRG